MHFAPKICEAFSARVTCSSSVPFCALKDRALGQTDTEGELQLDTESVGMIADLLDRRFIRERRGWKRHHRPRELDRAQVVEELDRRELVAADAAVDRSQLDAGSCLCAQQSGHVEGRGGRSEKESASIESIVALHDRDCSCGPCLTNSRTQRLNRRTGVQEGVFLSRILLFSWPSCSGLRGFRLQAEGCRRRYGFVVPNTNPMER